MSKTSHNLYRFIYSTICKFQNRFHVLSFNDLDIEMNSYDLIFGGSVWLMVVLMLAAIIFTFAIYRRTNPPLPPLKKSLMMGLRIVALLSLIFFIFEPVLTKKSGLERPPIIRFFFDNSISMTATDASGSKADIYKESINQLDVNSVADAEYFTFSDKIKRYSEIDFDSLDFTGNLTNLYKPIDFAAHNTQTENIRAAILVTDGQYNSGESPIYKAESIGIPIYILAIGDSTMPRDVLTKSILTNEIGYVNSMLPVNVKVNINGYEEGDSVEVKLIENVNRSKREVGSRTIQVHKGQSDYSLLFDYKATRAGYINLTASAEEKENEVSYDNNTQSLSIKILEKKRTIAIFGGSPNSDISFITKYLAEDKDIQVKRYIQRVGGDFYNQPNETELEETEMIIFSDFPNSSTPAKVMNMIKQQLDNKKPLFFISGYNTNYQKLKQLEDYLPFNTMKTGSREFEANPSVTVHALSSPLIKIEGNDKDLDIWNKLPPIFKTETFVRIKPESNLDVGVKVNGVELNEPLILSRYWQGQKSIAVLGYGIYRWKLMGKAADEAMGNYDTPDVFEIFLNNSFKWLSVSNRNKRFIVKTVEKEYAIGETVEFTGELYDRAYSPIDNAEIKISIPQEGKPDYELIMQGLGNGRYSASVEGLKSGYFVFKAKAQKDGRNVGSTDGFFSVKSISPEYYSLNMNAKLLREIAVRSGGKFYTPENVDEIINDIQNNPKFQSYSITLSHDINLWNKWELLVLAILCFAIEWFLRKRNGLL